MPAHLTTPRPHTPHHTQPRHTPPCLPQIGAVNTLVRQEGGGLKGYNTDWSAAIAAIEQGLGAGERASRRPPAGLLCLATGPSLPRPGNHTLPPSATAPILQPQAAAPTRAAPL